MRDTSFYSKNLFLDSGMGASRLAALISDHFGRVRDRNSRSGGRWEARLDAVVEAMDGCERRFCPATW